MCEEGSESQPGNSLITAFSNGIDLPVGVNNHNHKLDPKILTQFASIMLLPLT